MRNTLLVREKSKFFKRHHQAVDEHVQIATRLKAEIEKARLRIQILEDEAVEAEQQSEEALRTEKDAHRDTKSQHALELAQLRDEVSHKERELEDLRGESARALATEKKEKAAAMQKLEMMIAQKEDSLRELTSQLDAVKADKTHETRAARLADQVQSLEAEIGQSESLLVSQRREHAKSLQDKRAEYESDLAKLTAKVREAELKSASDVDALKAEKRTLEARIRGLDVQIEELTEEKSALEKVIASLKDAQRDETTSLVHRLSAAESAARDAKVENASQADENATLRKQAERLVSANHALEEEVTKALKELQRQLTAAEEKFQAELGKRDKAFRMTLEERDRSHEEELQRIAKSAAEKTDAVRKDTDSKVLEILELQQQLEAANAEKQALAGKLLAAEAKALATQRSVKAAFENLAATAA